MININTKLFDYQEKIYEYAKESLELHNEAGIELFTSGGKSFIAKRLIEDYINKYPNKRILWISTKSAVDNVRVSYFDKEQINLKIDYLNFSKIARYDETIPLNQDWKKYSLIVIDEAHRGLANYTYIGIKNILNNSSAHLLAMTATPKRYSDGINALEALITKGKIIHLDLHVAMQLGLVPMVNYFVCPLSLIKTNYDSIDMFKRLSDKYGIYKKELVMVDKALNDYSFSIKEGTSDTLLNTSTYTGEDGDRYIAFYSTILELKEMSPVLRSSFEKAYPNCKVNILPYHSKQSEYENKYSLSVMQGPVNKNVIDIMVTVDKGGESIHPENMRGVLMYRCTKSERVYKQQLGRAIRLKEVTQDGRGVFIYDFVDNVSVVGGSTFNIGYYEAEDRPGKIYNSANTTIDKIKSDIAGCIKNNEVFNVRFANEELDQCLEIANEMTDIFNWLSMYEKIDDLLSIGRISKLKSIYDLIEESDLSDDDKYHTKRWFKQVQQRYISKAYDEYETEKKDYMDLLGVRAYITPGMKPYSINRLYFMDDINKRLDDINYDYSLIAINKMDDLARDINEIRKAYINQSLSSAEVIFARNCGIDIDIKNELSDEDIKQFAKARNSKKLVRLYNKIAKEMEERTSLEESDLMDIKAAMISFEGAYSKILGRALSKKLSEKFGNLTDSLDISQKDYDEATKILDIVFKVKNKRSLNAIDNDIILDAVDSNGSNLSDLSKSLLKVNGITTGLGGNFNSILGNKTDFMGLIRKVIKDQDVEAYLTLKEYNFDSIPSKYQKAMLTPRFKTSEKRLSTEANDKMAEREVQMLFEPNIDSLRVLKSLVDNGYKPYKLIIYAFTKKARPIMQEYAEKGELSYEDELKLRSYFNSPSSCTKRMIENLSKCTWIVSDKLSNRLLTFIKIGFNSSAMLIAQ